jgi:uncharacterized protein
MTTPPPRSPLVISHAACLDGSGSALAAYLRFGDAAEYRFARYDDPAPPDADLAGRDVYVIDFSYSRAELERMLAAARSLRVLDHHKSARDALAGFAAAEFDMNRSGAVMAYEHFFPSTPVPPLFLDLQDRDLWRWQRAMSREINLALEARGFMRDFRIAAPLVASWAAHAAALASEGATILAYITPQVAAAADRAVMRKLDGIDCATVASSVLPSEIGEELMRRGHALVAIYSVLDDGRFSFNLRSAPPHDCAAIATRFGGGGHAQAAGFRCRALPWYW